MDTAITTQNLTSEETQKIAFKHCRTLIKAKIKENTKALRNQKQEVKQLQRSQHTDASYKQSSLYSHSQTSRALFLTYGLLRGHEWNVMEPNHAEGENVPYFTKFNIKAAWNQLQAETLSQTGITLEAGKVLERYLQ